MSTAVSWSYSEVETFLRLVADERIQRELGGVIRNERVFREVAKQMAAHGYQRTAHQCRQKLKKLKSDYRAIKAINDKGAAKKKTWKWFDQLDGIYRHQLMNSRLEVGVESTTTMFSPKAEPISTQESSTSDILDPPYFPTSAPATDPPSTPTSDSTPPSTPTAHPTLAATSASNTGKRKRAPTRPDLVESIVEEMQAEDERDRAQCNQHIRLLLSEAREAREQEAALRREEMAQNASFNQAFLGVLDKLVQAMSGPTRQSTINRMQTENQMNRDQCDQHIPFSPCEAGEQDTASQRKEMAQKASLDQAFLGVLSELGQAVTGQNM